MRAGTGPPLRRQVPAPYVPVLFVVCVIFVRRAPAASRATRMRVAEEVLLRVHRYGPGHPPPTVPSLFLLCPYLVTQPRPTPGTAGTKHPQHDADNRHKTARRATRKKPTTRRTSSRKNHENQRPPALSNAQMHACIYMHVYMYACMHARTYARTHARTYVRT